MAECAEALGRFGAVDFAELCLYHVEAAREAEVHHIGDGEPVRFCDLPNFFHGRRLGSERDRMSLLFHFFGRWHDQRVIESITSDKKKVYKTLLFYYIPLVSKKETRTEVISMKVTKSLQVRLEEVSERTGIPKAALAQQALEAAVEAIERNGFRLVTPIEFEVTHVPVPTVKTEAPAPGRRPGVVVGGRSSGLTDRSSHGLNEGEDEPAPRLVDSPAKYGKSSARRSGN